MIGFVVAVIIGWGRLIFGDLAIWDRLYRWYDVEEDV